MENIVKFLKCHWDEALADPKTSFFTVDTDHNVIVSRRQKRKRAKRKLESQSHIDVGIPHEDNKDASR